MDTSNITEKVKDLLDFCRNPSHTIDKGRSLGPILIEKKCVDATHDGELIDAMISLLEEEMSIYRQHYGIAKPISRRWVDHKDTLREHDMLRKQDLRAWSVAWAYFVCKISTAEIAEEAKYAERTIQIALFDARTHHIPSSIEERIRAGRPTPKRSGSSQANYPLGLAEASRPGSAPTLPTILVGRDYDLQQLKERLGIVGTGRNPVRIQVLTAMHGWPGVGKTTIAAALAHDPDISRTFPDGVLWASLGQDPNVFAEILGWHRALGIPDSSRPMSTDEASAQLAAYLRNQRRILILDDVWDQQHARPFMVGGAGCALILTTRLQEIAQAIAATPNDIYLLGVLSDEHALELLERLAPVVVAEKPAASLNLVKMLEGLPLGIQVAGHLLRTEMSYGFDIDTLLGELSEGVRLLNEQAPPDLAHPDDAPRSVTVLLRKSTDLLEEDTLEYFAFLGAFAPKPATFDEAALKGVWQLGDVRPVIRQLVGRGLLEVLASGRYWLHALLVAHAKTFLTDD